MIVLNKGILEDIKPGLEELISLTDEKESKVDKDTAYNALRWIRRAKNLWTQIVEERDDILKVYGKPIFTEDPKNKNENGDPVMVETGRYEIIDKEGYISKIKELRAETVEVSGTKEFNEDSLLDYMSINGMLSLELITKCSDEEDEKLRQEELQKRLQVSEETEDIENKEECKEG